MATPTSPAQQALLGLRVAVATLLFIHGTSRAATGGVTGFGEYLNSMHIPLGLGVAWFVTLMEIGGTVTLAAGRFIRPLALYFAAELTLGINRFWIIFGQPMTVR